MPASYATKPSVSIVVPVFNEEGSLDQLHAEVREVCQSEGYPWEMILIDDGSTDSSWSCIEKLASEDPHVQGVRFRRNFGKAAALQAGFGRVNHQVVVMMDADLQDTPAELPKLLAKLDEGYDVVTGWKRKRHDPWHKRWPSKGFNGMVSRLSGVYLHDHNCGFKCLKREVIAEIDLYGERHRFIPVLSAAQGFRVAECVVEHRPRTTGVSKYGWGRIPKGLLDALTIPLVTRFRTRPQHWLGSGGLVALVGGAACMAWLAGHWALSRLPGGTPIHLHESAMLYYAITLTIIGAQFLSVGLIAEFIVATATKSGPAYSISETTEPAATEITSQAA